MSITGDPTNITIPETTAANGYAQEMNRLEELRASGGISEYSYNKAKFELIERERLGPAAAGQDTIGAGRYILSFFLTGFLGLGVAYFLRKEGWLAIWVNLGLMVAVVAAILMI